MRVISEVSWLISAWAAVRALLSLVPVLAACTARSRMRLSMFWISLRAPSAVCTTEMPSWALRVACRSPETWARRPWLMTSPAASSAARLIRKPDDSFSRLLAIEAFVDDRLR